MAIITISRGTFSGGQAVAEWVGERLGYQVISREEIIDAAVASYGVPVEKIVAAMEKPPAFWERLINERSDYLNYMRAALFERARENNLVFHGFVGHLMLSGISHVLRVRVFTDLETRIQTAMQRRNLGREQAVALVKKIDRDRYEWTKFLWNVDWADPGLYDVVLNATSIGVDGVCETVARMTELPVFQPTPESLKAMEDRALASRVWVALAADSETAGADLKVEADGGIVTISGTTRFWEVMDAIPMVALRVEGVREVKMDVTLAPVYDAPI
jgi:cytidylate kinase